MIASPLEQFKIHSIIPLHAGSFDFSITNATVYMLASVGLFLLLCHMVFHRGGRLIPSLWQCVLEMIYEFVYALAAVAKLYPEELRRRTAHKVKLHDHPNDRQVG